MLSSAIPSLASSSPSGISDAVLPELRSIVLLDNTSGDGRFEAALSNVKCAVDLREIFTWQQSTHEDERLREISEVMQKDDVINLQFTRYFVDSDCSNL